MKRKQRGYLKHSNDAMQGHSLSCALADKKYFLICLFWAILERANQLDTQGQYVEELRYFERVLRVKRTKIERSMNVLRSYFESLTIVIQSDNVQISIDNYAKYQENRGGKRVAKEVSNGPTYKIKDIKGKIKEVRLNTPNPTKDFLEVYNSSCGDLPKAKALSKGRLKHLTERLKENPDLDYWRGVIERIAASDFCNGKNDRGWKADIDFLLRPDTHVKVIEGKYDNRGGLVVKKENSFLKQFEKGAGNV